jgi:hypothetical protein
MGPLGRANGPVSPYGPSWAAYGPHGPAWALGALLGTWAHVSLFVIGLGPWSHVVLVSARGPHWLMVTK